MRAMDLLKSWLTGGRGRCAGLARHLNVSPSFVNKMANGERPIPAEHGADIEKFTLGAVSRPAMFPVRWKRIWPEMVDAATPGAVALDVGDGNA